MAVDGGLLTGPVGVIIICKSLWEILSNLPVSKGWQLDSKALDGNVGGRKGAD